MRTSAALVAVFVLSGCAHAGSANVAQVILTAAFIAVEVAAAEHNRPRPPPCPNDEIDPPHTCPGVSAGTPER